MKITEILVRFDDGNELVLDDIGDQVSPTELGFRMAGAIYRVLAEEMTLGDVILVDRPPLIPAAEEWTYEYNREVAE